MLSWEGAGSQGESRRSWGKQDEPIDGANPTENPSIGLHYRFEKGWHFARLVGASRSPLCDEDRPCNRVVLWLHGDAKGESAEFAILLRSHLKGHGLGWLMMKHMIANAKAKGLKTVHGQILAQNRTMLEMCTELGFHMTDDLFERGIKVVTLPLDEVPGDLLTDEDCKT